MRCFKPIVKNTFARQRRRFEFRIGLHGLLGGGLVAALVHLTAMQHALGIGGWMLVGFLAGVAFGRANKGPSNASPPSNIGHRISDDMHALEKRAPQWAVPAIIALCVALDLSGTFAANVPDFVSELGAIHRWVDSVSGWQATNSVPPASSHPSINPARPQLIRL